jgi:pilus assembly protein CpaB
MEVTPRIAERIAVAQTLGTISLTLRSIADNQSELDRAIASGSVNLPANVSGDEEEAMLRNIAARPGQSGSTFQTGGDVSRFQRSTMPSRAPANNGPQLAEGPAAARVATPSGPTVRVTRGKNTSVESVDRGAGALLDRQADAMGTAARVAPVGMSTLR